jgi:hypothetical protein
MRGETGTGQITARACNGLAREGFRAEPPAWLSAGCERQLAELEDRLERAGGALEEILRAL